MIVAIARRPRAIRCSTAARAPPKLSESTRRQRLVGRAAAADHRRDPQLGQQVGQRVVRVDRDQQDPVHPVRRQVLGQPAPLPVAAREDQQELHLGVGEFRADPAQHVGEVRLGEEAGLGLGDDQGDRVRAVGGEGAGRRLGTYPSSATAASTAARVASLTRGEPLITRETVPRPTPARAATSSRVGRPPPPPAVAAYGSAETPCPPPQGCLVRKHIGSGCLDTPASHEPSTHHPWERSHST